MKEKRKRYRKWTDKGSGARLAERFFLDFFIFLKNKKRALARAQRARRMKKRHGNVEREKLDMKKKGKHKGGKEKKGKGDGLWKSLYS